jgi:hypothetical protein
MTHSGSDENTLPAASYPRSLVRACCEEVGLDPDSTIDEVLDVLVNPPDRACCDSGCDPCILTIFRAASLVRSRHKPA